MIQFKSNNKYRVQTPSGFKDFSGMRKTTKSKVVEITLSNGKYLEVSEEHRFLGIENVEILAKDLIEGICLTKKLSVTKVSIVEKETFLYDLTDVGDDSYYLTDDIVSHNCDFMTSGATVLEPELLNWYDATCAQDPMQRTGIDSNIWLWEMPDYSRTYAVVADVARGDGRDYSSFHILDIESAKQVGEYKGQLDTRDFGNMLVGVATQYNDALLVIENTGIGWDVVQTAVHREYRNLYYSPKSDAAMTDIEVYISKFDKGDGMVPGFSTTQRSRPLVIAKMKSYMQEKSCTIQSKRLLEELRTFVWKHGKAQAQEGYNDDLVMAWAIGLFLRDTTLRFQQVGQDLSRATLGGMTKSNYGYQIYQPTTSTGQNPWEMPNPYGQQEDIRWVL